MDVILKVLEGAKVGTKVAIKKDEFLIGRSPKCHLCTASNSISRQHCALVRRDATVWIKDLGSRNGTVLNGNRITKDEEVQLTSGDEFAVGSLRFLVTISHGIKNLKQPEVKSVAEAVDRTAEQSSGTFVEDNISNWLIDHPDTELQGNAETETISMDDTNAVQMGKSDEEIHSQEADATEPDQTEPAEDVAKKATRGKKKRPGKLPPRSSEPESKDSREAAMQALRNWNRRR